MTVTIISVTRDIPNMETLHGDRLLYPIFKMMVGAVCIILAIEYGYAFCVYQAASFGIFYIGDLAIWLSAGLILFSEGLLQYLEILKRPYIQERQPIYNK